MNRAGLRAIRVGRLSALVRPKALAYLSLFALMALGLLGFARFSAHPRLCHRAGAVFA